MFILFCQDAVVSLHQFHQKAPFELARRSLPEESEGIDHQVQPHDYSRPEACLDGEVGFCLAFAQKRRFLLPFRRNSLSWEFAYGISHRIKFSDSSYGPESALSIAFNVLPVCEPAQW